MKEIIVIILLLFPLNVSTQTEKISLKRKNEIGKNLKEYLSDESNLIKIELLNSLYEKVLNLVLCDLFSDKNITDHISIKLSELKDSSAWEIITIILAKGGYFDFEKDIGIISEAFDKRTLWNYLEFEEYICLNKKLPFHLIEKIEFQVDILLKDNLYSLKYFLKANDMNDIIITNKVFVQEN